MYGLHAEKEGEEEVVVDIRQSICLRKKEFYGDDSEEEDEEETKVKEEPEE